MSRSFGIDCIITEYENFLLCTNLLILSWVWCEGSFQGSSEKGDIMWSRRVKSLSLGMPPWFIPTIFRETQASKLGDAQGIPFFINKLIRSSLVKLYFNSFTSYALYLERLCAFIFVFVWINLDPRNPCVGERHAPLFHVNTHVLHLYLLSILN